MSNAASGPLTGFKIVEMAGLAPGPFCAMMLADMGAEIIRVERAGVKSEDGEDVVLNRNRRSIALNLKSEAGKDTLRRLLTQADAFIEGFRPGVMERLGLGPEDCLALNPKLVYGRMTGWGQDGPLALAAGHDINYIALTGALHSIGRKGEAPIVPLNLVGDFGGGGLLLAFGILCALLEASRSGKGQVVDAAMVDGAAALMAYIFGWRAKGTWSDVRGENILDGAAPWYHVYQTKDGHYVTIASAEPQFYAALLRVTGLDKANDLPAQYERARWPEMQTRLAQIFRSKTRAEWCEAMEGADVCFAPVLDIPEALMHPHNKARNTFIEINGVPQPAPAPRFSRTPPATPRPPVFAGSGEEETLAGWGFTAEDVKALRQSGNL